MANELKKLFLLTPADLKRLRKLVRRLDDAITELIELKRITTFDDLREHYPPAESDFVEETSFVEYQYTFPIGDSRDF